MPLLLSSYKGAPFHITSAEDFGGRRLAEHEYPNAEDWYIEDLGIAINSYKVTGYVSTDCEPEIAYAAAEALRAVCRTPGPGPLILPPATFVSAHCKACLRTVHKDTQGWIAFSLEFVEEGAGGASAPFQVGLAVRLVASALTAAVSVISDQGGEGLQSFGPDPEHLIAAGDMVRTALAVVDEATQTAVVIPAEADILSRTLAITLNAVTAFEASGAATFIAPPSVAVVQPEILPLPGAPPALSPVVQAFSEMVSKIASYLQSATDTTSQPATLASQLQASVFTLGVDPLPNEGVAVYPGRTRQTAYSVVRQGVMNTVGQAVQILVGISMCQAYASATYDRRMDAQAARGLMVGTVEQIINGIDDLFLQSHPGADELMQARDSASSAILSIIADLRPMVQMTLNQSMPALYLAWRIYQDPNRAQELADRNDAPHPFFMPSSFEAQAP